MFKNYVKTAWRNLLKNRISSFINIASLAVGMAVSILIGLWIWNEISYNTYHKNYTNIAKIRRNINVNGNIQTEKTVPLPLAGELRTRYGNYFKYIVMSSHRAQHVLSYGDKNLIKQGVFFEPQAPEMLTLNMLKGSSYGLKNPSSILLSQSSAKAIFGDMEPINKIIKIDNKLLVKVTGVYKDLPSNSTFSSLAFIAPFQLYVSNENWLMAIQHQWNKSPVQEYVQIADNADMYKVSRIIQNVILNNGSTAERKYQPRLFLEPMSKWHLYAEYSNGINSGGKIQYVWMFAVIVFFVLLLACINFMNLSTARSQKRSKEVGIRKVIGSLRSQLVKQFFIESLLIVILAFCLSLFLVEFALPYFNGLAYTKISVPWGNLFFWLLNICFILFTAIIAGSYPAFYLSSFQPIKGLKGIFMPGRFASLPRKILVVLQFSISVILIICTIVVFRQIQFARDRPIGYNTDGLLLLPMFGSAITDHFDAFKDELLKTGSIKNAALSEGTITDVWGTNNDLEWQGKDPGLTVDFPNTGVSASYGKTVGWKFKEGRDFSSAFPSDSSAFILTESAVKFMTLKNPVGAVIKYGGKPFTVIGVIEDVITESPYDPVRPSIFCMARSHDNFAVIRLNPKMSTLTSLAAIASVVKKFDAAQPFDYKFIDAEYANKFSAEQRAGSLASFFAILAIFISCLGLLGMASFMAEQRTKEIGVRKILGASVFSLWKLLSKEFVLLIFFSLLIAFPVAYYFMHNWLQNYNYRYEISWWIFAIAGSGALLITLITVSFQAIKAAVANPVKSMRTE